MLSFIVKIGLAPFRRDVTPRPGIFNWEKAEERGQRVIEYIRKNFADDNVSFIGTESITPTGVLATEEDALKAAAYFQEEKADAVFLINCNFGNEEAAGLLAQTLKKPVLLWAPVDEEFAPDGMRYTDSQCGLFGVSRMLQRLNIHFSYIETCRVQDEAFAKGLTSFASVTCMVKNFTGLRIAQVGTRPKPFASVMYNESELMQKFGIRCIPINLAVITDKYNRILEERKEDIEKGAELLASQYETDDVTQTLLPKMYAFVLLYEWIFEEYRVDAISSECWTAMQLAVGAMPCAAFSVLADRGCIIGCESDVHGTITMALLRCATLGRKVPFFGEFTVRHPENKNAELLWHCGPFAYSLKKADTPCKNVNMRPWFEVKDGSYTVARLDQDKGKYSLLAGTCRSTEGPYTFGTYLWAEFDSLAAWEKKLIEGPYIHHMAEIEGNYTAELNEFCKYMQGIMPDCVLPV